VFVSFSVLLSGIVNKSNFSHKLIKEYQNELYETFGVFVRAATEAGPPERAATEAGPPEFGSSGVREFV